MKKILILIEKLFATLVLLPPMYMLYRFIKWYLRQKQEPEENA